ncbi:lipase family alpha/beta hydrolase [Candidatus Palauibacter sp.]|uniref:lipase family alpha/beta hydrolase n=1 Tax=Candidatus Palauibacter sp. TaxID=3101350 RepID=UPI003B52822C
MPAEPRPIEPPHYPIIYVRGYAATMREIEETVGTPYMGFNLGSTKVRQGHAEDRPVRFIFESPLIRLMKDEDYIDAYRDGDFVSRGQRVDSRSVWIFRYYEQDSKSFGDGEKDPIESYAEDLAKFILRVREQVCLGDDEELEKFKVYLVAHSMGGLICRTYLQNVARGEEHYVDKVFTYATPHGGIEMMGVNAPDLGALDKMHVRNFNRAYMRKYLKLPPGARVTSLDDAFSPNRFFCFVGTDYKDYGAFLGLSKRAAGPTSDGLVMMKNAVVDEAPRAFAHRSHSGPFGIVNSEEGYQNLRRFLFGQVRIDALLAVDEITLPRAVRNKKAEGKKIRARYNIDTCAKVRGGGCYLSERRVRNESAIRKRYEDLVEERKPAYLFSGFLLQSAKTSTSDTALAFAIEIAIEVPLFEVDEKFWLDEHFEGETLLNETVTLHLRWRHGGKTTVRSGLRTRVGSGHAAKRVALAGPDEQGRMRFEIPLGFEKGLKNPPRPGFRGRLLLTASPWNT